jgi:hypothetical protein
MRDSEDKITNSGRKVIRKNQYLQFVSKTRRLLVGQEARLTTDKLRPNSGRAESIWCRTFVCILSK